ncbi:uncharacterized protein BDCG_07896 [Blastomyces dermatitidis ER-3]|uniref:FAR1 domain-containing protein n=1 Tax=Ajellomyces dermatitidis (strain ER-3 / ATCC MYA-2586) TaxID=559297 RepID=A0ABP2EQK5_AJEDR|nr:uncharacterized protein BDCG_07896 [Blastomyces dermatitidis ER-3]EEQ84627.2 hypothetical protein BDCG_07896 [Blastomyces dermatitidis ER-3]
MTDTVKLEGANAFLIRLRSLVQPCISNCKRSFNGERLENMTSIPNAGSHPDATYANTNCRNNMRDIDDSAEPIQKRPRARTFHEVISNRDTDNDDNNSTARQSLPQPTQLSQSQPEFQLQLQPQLECQCQTLPPPPPRTFENLEIATTYIETWAIASGYRIVPPRRKQPDSKDHSIHLICDGIRKFYKDPENGAPIPLENKGVRKGTKSKQPAVKSRKIACPFRLSLLLKMGVWHVDVSNPSHNHGRLPLQAITTGPERKRGRPIGSRTCRGGREKFVQLEGGGAMISFRFDNDTEATKYLKQQGP